MKLATALYNQTPRAFSSEKRDCAVRALRVAARRTYEEAHRILKAYGRIDRRGTFNWTVDIAARAYRFWPVDTGMATLAQFTRAHPEGRFVLRVNSHFLALVDGVVHDWNRAKTGPRTRVVKAWGRS